MTFKPFIPEIKSVFKLGIPIIAGQVAQMSMGFVDTIMAGNLSPDDLAAVAIGSSFVNSLFVFSIGLLMVLNPIFAQHIGANRINKLGITVRHGLYLALVLGILSFILIRMTGGIMHLLGIEPHVQELAQGYMHAISWGFFPFNFYLVLRFFNEGLSVTKPTMWFGFLGLITNIIGNYIFMYGKLGLPAMGAIGTGWSSGLVSWIMFFGMFLYTYKKKDYQSFRLFSEIKRPQWSYISEILKIGIPSGFSSFMEVSLFAVVTLFMGMLGTTIVAGHQIAINISSIVFMIPLGFSSAISIRVGMYIGKSNREKARTAGYAGIALCFFNAIGTASVLSIIPGILVSAYTNDAEVSAIAVSLLYMAAIFQISDGLQVSGAGALRGLKDTTIPMIVNFISYWAIGLSTGYLLGIYLEKGPVGLWIGLIAGLSVAAVLHNSRFYYLMHKKEATT